MTTAADRDKAIAKLQTGLAALERRVVALEHPVPPLAAIPPIPAKTANTTLHHDFAKDGMGPFVAQDYPNAHEADKDPMLGWNPDKSKPRYLTQRFTVVPPTVHDGFLDLYAVAGDPGLPYSASLVATFAKNDATKPTFEFQYGTLRWMARFIGKGAAAWQTLWMLAGWGPAEIDWPEVIGGKMTANLHGAGSADGEKVNVPLPGEGWHEYSITRTPTTITFGFDTIDGSPKAVAMPQKMALLIDAKYGLAAPDATTPAELRTQVAWVVVTE